MRPMYFVWRRRVVILGVQVLAVGHQKLVAILDFVWDFETPGDHEAQRNKGL